MYGIRLELPVLRQADERGAIEIALRSRRSARAEEQARWAAEEERRAGREPRSSCFRARSYPLSGRFCRRELRSSTSKTIWSTQLTPQITIVAQTAAPKCAIEKPATIQSVR